MTDKMLERTARYIVVVVEGLKHTTTYWGDPDMKDKNKQSVNFEFGDSKPPRTLTRFQAIKGLERARKLFPNNKYKIMAFYYVPEESL